MEPLGDVTVVVGPGVGTAVFEGPVLDELEVEVGVGLGWSEELLEDVRVTEGVRVPVPDGLCVDEVELLETLLDEEEDTTVVPGGKMVGIVGSTVVGTGI